MRRLVAALVVLTVAVLLTGCGGGESSSSTPPPAASSAPPPPATAAAPAASAVASAGQNTLSPRAEGTGTPFPDGQAQPGIVRTRLEQRSPMVVFFYDPAQITTKDVRRELDAAMKRYRGLIALVELDASAAMGEGSVSKPTSESVAQQTSLLAQTLNVDFTPYLVFVDRKGIITGRFRGYVDRGLLEREIIRASQ